MATWYNQTFFLKKPMDKITLIQPDDWHCHLRDNEFLTRTVADTARRFARAIVMPNLSPPVTSMQQMSAYRQRIIENIPEGFHFTPLMTLYLTESMSTDEISVAKKSGVIYAAKLYPAGATTHSQAGVGKLTNIYSLFERMQEVDLPLLIHGESTDLKVDIFDREKCFIEKELAQLIKSFPKLRIVLEHISTQEAVEFIRSSPANIAATITAHHLWYNRNALLNGGLKPHYYCMPILKTERDRQALLAAAVSGHSQFFLGTDSAPHPRSQKESACGCAGIYSAPAAIELYTQIFAEQGALNQLEKFASINGPHFYGLPINTKKMTLVQKSWQIPSQLTFGNTEVTPMCAGESLKWQIE